MAIQDITYIRSSIEFTGISDTKDIKKTKSITVSWKLNLKYATDLTHLYLLRAILDPLEAADVTKESVKKKFKVIYKWERGIDSGEYLTKYVDQFKWDNNSDSNLHNLNINNEGDWNESKFNRVLSRIVGGEQGVYYKIYGYSRRMNRAATPLGFFCDGKNIVALSQRNQVINDTWYSECGQVWRSGPGGLNSDECFCRVAVDMERDLGVNPKKCRRVWASTNKGRIVLFDYWTGEIIKSIGSGTGNPIYAVGFCPQYRSFLYYDGNGSVKIAKENVDTHEISISSLGLSDFGFGSEKAKRVMGGVCTWEGEKDSRGNPICYFYIISNRETVVKIEILNGTLNKKKVIPRTHFGCTTTLGDSENDGYLGETSKDQNNIYGIGAGANGHVWVNGHTPITLSTRTVNQVKKSGNPIEIYVSLGRGATGYKSNGTAKYPKFRTDESEFHYKKKNSKGRVVKEWYHGGCWRSNKYKPTSSYGIPITILNRMKKNSISAYPDRRAAALGNNDAPTKNYELVYKLTKGLSYGLHFKRGSAASPKTKDSLTGFNYDVYHYSAKFAGESRPRNSADRNLAIGCKSGINGKIGLKWIKKYIGKYNRFGQKIDQRVLGAGTKITKKSFGKLYMKNKKLPSNKPNRINAIHHELVAVFDGPIPYEKGIDISFLQDVNYVYGCTDNENINDSNGQIEDVQNFSSIDYRNKIVASTYAPAAFNNTRNYFSPMTKLLSNSITGWADKYSGMFGYVGEPSVFKDGHLYISGDNFTTRDKMTRKPHTYSWHDANVERSLFKSGIGTENVNLETIDVKLPMSIGSISPMVPLDGRMRVERNNRLAYKGGNETNALSYYIPYADRREGKIGLLSYSRASGSIADIGYKETNRRVSYTAQTDGSFNRPDSDREYFPTSGSSLSQVEHLNSCPYHVVADSDNNLWFTTPTSIGKLQLLGNKTSGGRDEKYVYNTKNGFGLHAYENNNKYFESSLILLEKQATYGPKSPSGGSFYHTGIENGESVHLSNALYKEAHELLQRNLNLSKNNTSNNAYVYNYSTWNDVTFWNRLRVFGKDNVGVWNVVYEKRDYSLYVLASTATENEKIEGVLNNEFNSDNFGLNCLMQMNKVEVGPDMIHPTPGKPTAKSRITRSVSTSHNDRCDSMDDRTFWNKRTKIFNREQATSGYDDLDTTHQIYDIVTNGRKLINHRYEYHDSNIVGPSQKIKKFEYDNNGNIQKLDEIYDNSPEMVWRVPNYRGLVPPYGSLSTLSANIDPDTHPENYWVDIYLDYTPSVYDLWSYGNGSTKESMLVGKHYVHVFERWPTTDFCVRNIGNSESVDKITDQDLIGVYYWGNC